MQQPRPWHARREVLPRWVQRWGTQVRGPSVYDEIHGSGPGPPTADSPSRSGLVAAHLAVAPYLVFEPRSAETRPDRRVVLQSDVASLIEF